MAAGDGAEAGLGDEAVDDVGEGGEGVGVEVGDVGEAVAEDVRFGVEGWAGDVVEDEVVEAGVEGFGDGGETSRLGVILEFS